MCQVPKLLSQDLTRETAPSQQPVSDQQSRRKNLPARPGLYSPCGQLLRQCHPGCLSDIGQAQLLYPAHLFPRPDCRLHSTGRGQSCGSYAAYAHCGLLVKLFEPRCNPAYLCPRTSQGSRPTPACFQNPAPPCCICSHRCTAQLDASGGKM